MVDSTLSVVNSLVRPIELHRELEEQNVTDTPASYSRDIQMQLFRLVHGWSETNDVDITQIASVKQSKIPVALSGLHFEYFVSNTSSSDVKSSDTSSLMTTTISTTTTTTTKKSKKKKRNSKVVRTPPPPSRKKRKTGAFVFTVCVFSKSHRSRWGRYSVLETIRVELESGLQNSYV